MEIPVGLNNIFNFITFSQKKTFRFFASGILISVFFILTANVDAANFSPTLVRGYVLKPAFWPKKENGYTNIPVCWENPTAAPLRERNWVRNSVVRTWEANSLVRFTGWGTCPTTDYFGVRILIEDTGPYTRGLGTELRGIQGGMLLNFTFKNWSQSCQDQRKFCIEAIAIHEFGHALSFAHEQNRPDTDSNCQGLRQGTDGDTLVGPWDLQSIMNYCSPKWNNGGFLSNVDKNVVKTAYGNVSTYYSGSNSIYVPVVIVNGVKYSAQLDPVGTKWRPKNLQTTTAESSSVATYSGTTLVIPFVFVSDGTNVSAFYRVKLRAGSDGLFSLVSANPL